MSKLLSIMREEKYKPPASIEGTNAAKLSAAKEWMGSKWILHPDYVFTEKHRIYNESHFSRTP